MGKAIVKINRDEYKKLTNLEKFQRSVRFTNMILKLHCGNKRSKPDIIIQKLQEYLLTEDFEYMTPDIKILFKLYNFKGN